LSRRGRMEVRNLAWRSSIPVMASPEGSGATVVAMSVRVSVMLGASGR
jgi:hypothetical protein